MRLQLIIDLIMHGTSLTSIALSSVSIFQLVGKARPQKKRAQIFFFLAEKIGCMVYIRKYHYVFSFTKTKKQFHKTEKKIK